MTGAPDPRPGFWRRRTLDGLTAVAEAMFPPNDLGAPTWQEAEVVPRTLLYTEALPPTQGRLVLALYLFVELAAPLLVPGFHRFSRLPLARRTLAIRGWRRSRFQLFRLLGDAIKAAMTMVYLSHPKVSAFIGEYKTCARPADARAMRHVPDALVHIRVTG
jgi:hypothetical protein